MNEEKKMYDCSGCTDRHSEGTHAMHTKQHPCPKGGDPNCGYCFPSQPQQWEEDSEIEKVIEEFKRKFRSKSWWNYGYKLVTLRSMEDFLRTTCKRMYKLGLKDAGTCTHWP